MGRKVLKVKNHKKNGSDAAVQGSNDSSIVSKCSTVDAGYFKDEFVNHFVNKRSRRSPLINRGYYVRAAAMDHVFQAFLKTVMCDNKQVVSLGAGFDSAYFRLKSQGLLENTTYFEVDFPDVMRRKKALIQNSPVLKELMSDATENSEEIILNCTDYKLLGVDLTQLDQLDQCLAKANKSMPTLVLSEVVLAYLDPEASSTIIEWMAANFESALFVSYEQVSPQDSFGIVMTNHFCKLRSPLRSIDTFPEGAAQVARCKKLGWSDVIATDMNYFYTSVLTSRERQRVESLEPFDEFEEWHLHCSHYILLTAFKGACLALRDTVWPDVIPDGETTGQVINQDMTTGVDDSSCMGDDGDGRLCVGDKRYYGTVKLQCQTQCNGCDETDLTLGRQGDSETTYHATKAALSHRCDGDRNVASSITTNSDTSKRALEWKCLPPVEGGQRFGHDSAMIGSQYAVTLGGFGADSGRHGRMRTLLVHRVLNGTAVDVNVAGDVGSDIENPFERMHHTLTPVGSASLLLFGGRLSPTKPCLQPFLLDFRLSKYQDLDHASGTQNVSCTCDDVILGSGNDAESTKVLGTDSGRCLSLEHRTMPNKCQNTVPMECFCQRLSTAGACPPPRWRHSAVNITIDESPHVIVFGGVSDNQTVFSDTYAFDVQRRSWSKLECRGEIPSPRHSHTANRWNGCMVVSCGLASDLRPLNSIFRLDVVSRTWTEVNIQMGGLMPRYSHTATIIGDRLAIVGGVCLTLQPPGVAVVDLVTGVHQEYVLPQQDPANPIMLHGHSGISSIPSLTERQFVVVGGGGNCFSFGTHLNATPILLTLPSET